jgi:arylsulfatase A-like enzyme
LVHAGTDAAELTLVGDQPGVPDERAKEKLRTLNGRALPSRKMSEPADSRADSVTRRGFLKRSPVAAGAPLAGWEAVSREAGTDSARPNVILIISDQFRWDCVGSNGLNPLNLTPNLDAMAREGVNFANAITNQPVCAPSRACLFTSLYTNRHGVWRNDVTLPRDLPTLATLFRGAGYTANYIGKWHLGLPKVIGAVAPEYRGGFDDLWEGCNQLEFTSHPYEGTIWDRDGRPIEFKGEYRVDFITTRAIRFLREKPSTPFFLVLSYLEPHFQNDCNCFVAPKGYAERYRDAFIPADLKFFPGDWSSQLPDYYGCIARVDENVGKLRSELARLALGDRTIVVFVSDHGCHFRTRNAEYKRSGHESSIHIPMVMAGPRFERSLSIQELVSQIDVAPTLLEACGIARPAGFQGRSMMPLLERRTEGWPNEVYVQISESMTGRALRTPQWTYVVAQLDGKSQPASSHYGEYQLYDLHSDRHQLVNLAGRRETREISSAMRERLLKRMQEAGEEPAEISPKPLYP